MIAKTCDSKHGGKDVKDDEAFIPPLAQRSQRQEAHEDHRHGSHETPAQVRDSKLGEIISSSSAQEDVSVDSGVNEAMSSYDTSQPSMKEHQSVEAGARKGANGSVMRSREHSWHIEEGRRYKSLLTSCVQRARRRVEVEPVMDQVS